MSKNEVKEKIKLELSINEYTKKEENQEGTDLKIELIKQLINNKIEYINIFTYYYDIIKLNEK